MRGDTPEMALNAHAYHRFTLRHLILDGEKQWDTGAAVCLHIHGEILHTHNYPVSI